MPHKFTELLKYKHCAAISLLSILPATAVGIEIGEVYFSEIGGKSYVEAVVLNPGTKDSMAFDADLFMEMRLMETKATSDQFIRVDSIKAGASKIVKFPVNEIMEGTIFHVVIDWSNELGLKDTGKNLIGSTVKYNADLIFSHLSIKKHKGGLEVSAKLANDGYVKAGKFDVQLTVGKQIYTKTVFGLAPGVAEVGTFHINAPVVGSLLTIEIDPKMNIEELSRSNNTRTIHWTNCFNEYVPAVCFRAEQYASMLTEKTINVIPTFNTEKKNKIRTELETQFAALPWAANYTFPDRFVFGSDHLVDASTSNQTELVNPICEDLMVRLEASAQALLDQANDLNTFRCDIDQSRNDFHESRAALFEMCEDQLDWDRYITSSCNLDVAQSMCVVKSILAGDPDARQSLDQFYEEASRDCRSIVGTDP